ncbi:MAG: GNAT family N-acetyltransferase [Deltaproteobacteria bacterium]|nr:GNAT family N-acetyltransferase [Deltaproteobacteria bacterium]
MDELKPKTYVDRLGSQFSVESCGPGDFDRVLDMYDSYMPEAVAQGLPPTDKETRHRWIRTLLEHGENYAAVRDGRVVAHVSLLPNMARLDGEFLIFVGTPHRRRGIATILGEAAIEGARELGLKSVWLTVESDNFRAIKLYKKMGFTFCDKGLSERKMARRI